MDWTIFHWLNSATRANDPGQDAAEIFNTWAIIVMIVSVGGLWLLAPPGGSLRWKLAAASAGVSALLGLAVNVALSNVWFDERPFVAHPLQTVLLIKHAPDNGFPSDHATVAFAVAFAVMAFSQSLGTLLIVAATAIALDRIFVGVHFPADLGAGVLVGLSTAALVTTIGRPWVIRLVDLASRVTDPIVATIRRPPRPET